MCSSLKMAVCISPKQQLKSTSQNVRAGQSPLSLHAPHIGKKGAIKKED